MNWKNAGTNGVMITFSITIVFLFLYLQTGNDIEFQQQAMEEQMGQLLGNSLVYGLIIATAGMMIKRRITKIKNKKKP